MTSTPQSFRSFICSIVFNIDYNGYLFWIVKCILNKFGMHSPFHFYNGPWVGEFKLFVYYLVVVKSLAQHITSLKIFLKSAL